MKTWKEIGKRYERWQDVALWVNLFGVYMYICLVGSSDIPALMLLAGLNTATIVIARREELKRLLTPQQEKSEMDRIIRRVK